MCTAATYKTKDFYFGRTLDYEYSYEEEIVIVPRNYKFCFRDKGVIDNHYAIIGIASVKNNYPLFYDAMNEKGLAIAGLNFVGNTKMYDKVSYKDNIAQFEFIPWLLCNCSNISEVKELLYRMNFWNNSFRDDLPCAHLHWLISDGKETITVESVNNGIRIYDNPVGVLTNNPTFDKQMFNLNNYMSLSVDSPKNTFLEEVDLKPYSRGMGAIGLPGDLSSQSRFVRAAFVRAHSKSDDSEKGSVSQFFHILNSVDQQRGCCKLDKGKYVTTIYTSCCNLNKGIYYYTTYDNHQISAVHMFKENLDCENLIVYPLIKEEQVFNQN